MGKHKKRIQGRKTALFLKSGFSDVQQNGIINKARKNPGIISGVDLIYKILLVRLIPLSATIKS